MSPDVFCNSLDVIATPADPHQPTSPTAVIVAEPPDGGGAGGGASGGGGGTVSAVALPGGGCWEMEGETGVLEPQAAVTSAQTAVTNPTSQRGRMIIKGGREPLHG
jgi:hypothetical protein